MIKMCSLYSGSSGNCIYVESGNTSLLVDCGVSGKKIENALCEIGVDIKKINAILLTHEHSDHICSAGIMHRKTGAAIYGNEATLELSKEFFGKIKDDGIEVFNGSFSVGDIYVTPFSIPHDASNPVGFTFSDGLKKVSVATDIGHMTDEVMENLKGSNIVLLEANHDVDMLLSGPYPYELKKRILSDIGHLSNENAGLTCARLLESGTSDVILGHLSAQNNHPDLCYVTVRSVLEGKGYKPCDYNITVASRVMPGDVHIC